MAVDMDGSRRDAQVNEYPEITPELTTPAGLPAPGTEADQGGEKLFTGIGLSSGIAIGQPCFYRPPVLGTAADTAVDETDRVRKALFELGRYCSDLAQQADHKLSRSAGDIFRAHSMLAEDPSLMAALEYKLASGNTSAEAAINETFDEFVGELQAATTSSLRERATDIVELKQTLLNYLARRRAYVDCRDSEYCQYGACRNKRDHILIATQFVPGAAISAGQYTRGFVVEQGGPSSHAAILARMMGLPAVSGIPDVAATLATASRILIDGDSGRVYVDPAPQTLAHYAWRGRRAARRVQSVVPQVKGFRVLADLDRTDDISQALAAHAEGVGLYRTESEMLYKQRLLSEDEQFERYSLLLDAIRGPVYVRLLDLGADKAAEWLDLPAEDNPALGCRGARLLLQRPELLTTQARALARASQQREIHVIYPMVHSVNQFLRLRELFTQAITDIPDSRLLHGVMFEVPSACLEAAEFFKHADFGRIGTNDLTQYLFAADRMNGSIGREDLFEQPALWQLIDAVVRAARTAGKSLSMCGELVTQPEYIGRILRAGISEISVCPQHIASLRRAAARLLESPEGICCSSSGQYSFLAV